jgi:O-antigen ligase
VASRAREAAAPLYLLLCLLLGGSVQGIWLNLLIQLLGIGLLAWAALARSGDPPDRTQKGLVIVVLLGLLIVLLQLVPLPPAVWEKLGGRAPIAEGFRLLGIAVPWQPLSLAPYDTLATMFALIPPLALLAAIWRLGTRNSWLVLALLAGMLAGTLLGALQVSSPDPANSGWYLYPFSNFGVATGFFANANHMAILLVISLPFLTALLASVRSGNRNVQRESAAIAMVAGTAVVIAVGIALNGSLAGYGLAVPVAIASALLLVPRKSAARLWIGLASGVLLVGAVAALALSPVGGSGFRSSATTSVQTREQMMKTSAAAAAEFMPFGSGVGTFERVYQLYEDHERFDVTAVVNHAHDDYLEVAVETGIPGLIVLLLFLAWWGRASWRAWTAAGADPYARAAVIASAAILVHSLVDFPLRTAAISTCFAMCLALIAQHRRAPATAKDGSTLWPTRHVVLG